MLPDSIGRAGNINGKTCTVPSAEHFHINIIALFGVFNLTILASSLICLDSHLKSAGVHLEVDVADVADGARPPRGLVPPAGGGHPRQGQVLGRATTLDASSVWPPR